MRPELWAAALIIATSLLLSAPLVPALLEWRRKTDAHPLKVARSHRGEATYFAECFQTFILERFANVLASLGPVARFEGRISDGTLYTLHGDGAAIVFEAGELREQVVRRLLVARGGLDLPPQFLFDTEIYSGGRVTGKDGSAYRAIFAEGSLHMGRGSYVLRWAHANGAVTVGAQSHCHGRVTSLERIEIGQGAQFLRLQAPTIDFGAFRMRPVPRTSRESEQCVKLRRPARLTRSDAGRWLIRGDLTVPRHSFHRGDIVASGTLRLEEGACIFGGLKSNQDLYLGRGVRIDGPVVAAGVIVVAEDCQILGPLVSEQVVHLGAGSRIGRIDRPTSVSAFQVVAASSVRAHGSVWARELGEVISETTS